MSLKILGCIPCVLHLGPQPRIWARGRCTGHVPHVSQDHCHTGNLTSQLLAVVLRCCCWSVGVALLFFFVCFCWLQLFWMILNGCSSLLVVLGRKLQIVCVVAWHGSIHFMSCRPPKFRIFGPELGRCFPWWMMQLPDTRTEIWRLEQLCSTCYMLVSFKIFEWWVLIIEHT